MLTVVSEPKLADFCQFAGSLTTNPDCQLLERFLRLLYRDRREEDALWFTALYQVYGDLASTAVAYQLLPSPWSPLSESIAGQLRELPNSGERPNLRGGLTVRHLADLQRHIIEYGGSLRAWLTQGWQHDPAANFTRFVATAQGVWGSGRLATYRWALLLKRVHHLPVAITGPCSGPNREARRALVRLYGLTAPVDDTIRAAAFTLRDALAQENIPIEHWEDLDLLLEKWYRLGKGHYTLGQDLVQLRQEIESPLVPVELRPAFARAWTALFADGALNRLAGAQIVESAVPGD